MLRNREFHTLGSIQNKSVSSSFKWVPEYILFLAKLKGKGRPFWSGQSFISPLNSLKSLTCWGNVNYYKSVHHPIPTLPDGIGNTQAVFRTNQYGLLSVECQGIFLAKVKGRGRFFSKSARRGATLWDYLQEHLVAIRDETLKVEIILPLLCFLLDALTYKDCRTWISMINFWIDSKTCQK